MTELVDRILKGIDTIGDATKYTPDYFQHQVGDWMECLWCEEDLEFSEGSFYKIVGFEKYPDGINYVLIDNCGEEVEAARHGTFYNVGSDLKAYLTQKLV